MKLNDSRRTKTQDTAHETDFEDSIAMNKIKKLKNRSKLKKIKKTNMKKKKTSFLQKMTDLALHSVNMFTKLENYAFSVKEYEKNFKDPLFQIKRFGLANQIHSKN